MRGQIETDIPSLLSLIVYHFQDFTVYIDGEKMGSEFFVMEYLVWVSPREMFKNGKEI